MTMSDRKAASPKQFVIDRTLKAPVEKVWKMWTTKEGLEKWWGPEGFSSKVSHLDVRVGGRFEIVMTALLPEIIAHLKSAGMGDSSTAKGDYTLIEPNRRLIYTNAVDFVPGRSSLLSLGMRRQSCRVQGTCRHRAAASGLGG